MSRILPIHEEKLTFFTESKEWSTFWRNTIQGLHDSNRRFTYNNNITRVIAAYPNSHIIYGSEFRNPDILQHLLKDSPFWPEVNNSLRKGAKYPLERISNKKRKLDLEDAIIRGNHKSAKIEIPTLKNLVNKDVKAAFQLPVPIETVRNTPHACIAPYGLAHQNTINELGEIIDKYRITHDQSFKFSSKTSVNDRVKREELLELIYGDAFRRIIHYIHSLRTRYPHKCILIGKYDFKSAYRRLTMWGHSAAASCTYIDGIAYISLRLTFGGAPCPFLW